MRKIHIIGIGAGDPDYMTVQAIRALNKVDVFFIPDKGSEKADLKKLRTDIVARFATERAHRTVELPVPARNQSPDYAGDVAAWHDAIAATTRYALAAHLAEDECGGFLVWGDPALYDSTLRIIARIAADGMPLDYDVIPGISAVQALAARHRIALNRIGGTVAITPGRRLGATFPDGIDDIVVVLDGDQAFARVEDDVQVFWGAYVGTPDEVLIAGPLASVKAEIAATRQRLRAAKGWIMDTYLLRRACSPSLRMEQSNPEVVEPQRGRDPPRSR